MLISDHYDGTCIPEALRMLKPGGLILRLDIASDWDGGELNQVIDDPNSRPVPGRLALYLVEC
jgi:hypothetical protein